MTDFTLLDRPYVRGMMFYPRQDRTAPPAGAHDLLVPVADGLQVHARIYAGEPDRPTILLFHGNGEVVSDYDGFAGLYGRAGLNLAVCEFRGYGRSGGVPAYTDMLADAHPLKAAVFDRLEEIGRRSGRYLMGRSMGAHSAVELAATDADGFRGVVFESGAANPRRWNRFAAPGEEEAWDALAQAQWERIAAIQLPLLTIHGAEDELIPLDYALEVHDAAGSPVKELCIVPGAGHNDLLFVGLEAYFGALAHFVAGRENAAPA